MVRLWQGKALLAAAFLPLLFLPVYFHPAGKRTLPSLVSFDLGKYKLLSPFLHGNYPGSADDRLFSGGLSSFDEKVEKESCWDLCAVFRQYFWEFYISVCEGGAQR